jgi:hypothetical protein
MKIGERAGLVYPADSAYGDRGPNTRSSAIVAACSCFTEVSNSLPSMSLTFRRSRPEQRWGLDIELLEVLKSQMPKSWPLKRSR